MLFRSRVCDDPFLATTFRNCKERYWAPSIVLCSHGRTVAEKASSQILQNDERIPRLTSRSCGEFPGIGRTLPSRHLRGRRWWRSDRDGLTARIGNLNGFGNGRSGFLPKAVQPVLFLRGGEPLPAFRAAAFGSVAAAFGATAQTVTPK